MVKNFKKYFARSISPEAKSIAARLNKMLISASAEEKQKQTELQKDVIVAKQKEIVDSIRYAQRIQSALIANEIYIARVLRELTDPERRKKK